eukprot:TRINITY_DN1345_c0_g1_i1.p1 TRINITY_DN1345_c0_g1~~TRINITY_DN1345_c0_g1_i1.p1  ORF type:complete len:233 (-),score=99.12 TRINITY_DN1345_c0_g1_i1:89-724(-)
MSTNKLFLCVLLCACFATTFASSKAEIVKRVFPSASQDAEYRVVKTEQGQMQLAADLGNCTASTCNNHGLCNDAKTACICLDSWITFNPQDGTQCNYEQKKQLTAFLLQFFVGTFGAADWYTGRWGIAVGKLVLILVVCCGQCVLKAMAGKFANGQELKDEEAAGAAASVGASGLCMCCVLLGQFGWWLADTILYGQNKINDLNDAPLKAW